MRRLVLNEPPRKKVEGPRVSSRAFGGGTIVKDGPEQSLVLWDDDRFNTFTETYIPNTQFKRLTH